jgi:hypothetical protein
MSYRSSNIPSLAGPSRYDTYLRCGQDLWTAWSHKGRWRRSPDTLRLRPRWGMGVRLHPADDLRGVEYSDPVKHIARSADKWLNIPEDLRVQGTETRANKGARPVKLGGAVGGEIQPEPH